MDGRPDPGNFVDGPGPKGNGNWAPYHAELLAPPRLDEVGPSRPSGY